MLKRFLILAFLISDLSLLTSATAIQQAWVAKYNLGPQSTNQAVALVIDPDGNIVVAGHGVSGNLGYDYILLKYSSAGTQVWARSYTLPGVFNDQVRDVKVDDAGNIFVTGTSETLMYSSDGTLLWNQPYAGRGLAVKGDAVYVTGFSNTVFATAKLSKSDGSNVWLKTFSVMGGPEGPSTVIALDLNTNVVVSGQNTCFTHPVPYANEYVVKYSVSGAELWTRASPAGCGPGKIAVKSIITDDSGNIYTLANAIDICYAYLTYKLSPLGDKLWEYRLPLGLCYDAAKSFALGDTGDLYITGTSLRPQTTRQFGTVKLNDNWGGEVWHQQYAGQGQHEANALALDAAGYVYVTGKSKFPDVTTPNDFATIKYDPQGNLQWAKRYNGPANLDDEATAIAVTRSGDVYVTGFSTTSSNLIEITTIKYVQTLPIEKKSNGNILLSFCGSPGSNYVIEASCTLTNWTAIGTTTANPSGLYTFEDTNAPSFGQRFYRTKQE